MSTAYISHADCRRHEMGAGHPECPQRLDAIEDWLIGTGLDVALQRFDASNASPQALERAHSSAYIAHIRDLLVQLAAAAYQIVPVWHARTRGVELRRADGKQPMHLGQCVAWALDGPAVAKVYPDFAAGAVPPIKQTPTAPPD